MATIDDDEAEADNVKPILEVAAINKMKKAEVESKLTERPGRTWKAGKVAELRADSYLLHFD